MSVEALKCKSGKEVQAMTKLKDLTRSELGELFRYHLEVCSVEGNGLLTPSSLRVSNCIHALGQIKLVTERIERLRARGQVSSVMESMKRFYESHIELGLGEAQTWFNAVAYTAQHIPGEKYANQP